MRTLFLHVGHSKTGSSFLQASFANSIERLAECGIDYPGAPSEAAREALRGQMLEERLTWLAEGRLAELRAGAFIDRRR